MRGHLLAPVVLLAGCRFSVDQPESTVLVVVMDGVRLEESLGDEPSSATGEDPWGFLPRVWDELVPEGVRATQAWSLGATLTTPAHVAMMAGRRQPLANYPVDGESGAYRPDLPLLPEILRHGHSIPRRDVVVAANTEFVQPVVHSLWPGLGFDASADFLWVGERDDPEQPASDDGAVLQALRQRMAERHVRFALVNLHQVDRSGHYGNHDAYLEDVRALDDPIADFWAWVRSQPEYGDDTWMLLVADHGRHSAADTEPPWRHHGCACAGCRRVPFLLLGPGVRAGERFDEPVLLVDVAPTLAALWDLPVPFAEGLVRRELFTDGPTTPSREGLADLAVAGGHRAEVWFDDDPWHRSLLLLDGEQVSSPDAIEVAAPVMAAWGRDRAWLCFREITLDPDALETPWHLRCLATEDGGLRWEDIGAPVDDVGPTWQAAALTSEDGDLLLAYPQNLNAIAVGGADGGTGEVSLDVARYRAGAWTVGAWKASFSFPTDASAVRQGEHVFVAIGAGSTGSDARYERDIAVGEAVLGEDTLTWLELTWSGLGQPGGPHGWWRIEHPALRFDAQGMLHLAATGFYDGGADAVLASSNDLGRHWQRSDTFALDGDIMPNIGPVWVGERAVWATLDPTDERVRLCAGSLDEPISCLGAGTSRILRLQADEDRLLAIVDAGQGQWEERVWGVGEIP